MKTLSEILADKENLRLNFGVEYDRQEVIDDFKAVNKLKADIKESFQNIPRPAITQHVARALDDDWIVSKDKAAEISLQDPETDWTQVTEDKIHHFQEYFTFSDDEGWAFYLPAYMMCFLSDFPSGYDAVATACHDRTYVAKLTPDQLACVIEFDRLCTKYEY